MTYEEKIKLMKAIPILRDMPQRQLAGLAEFLRPRQLQDREVLFQQGSIGQSLYLVSSGKVRISRRVAHDHFKDLAILGPGMIFGETALVAESPRMASAIGVGPCMLFELFRGDLSRWVKLNPQQALQFFAELVHVQTRRLRRSSNELGLQTDLADLLAEKGTPVPEFMAQVLDRVVAYMEGQWSGAVYLLGESGREFVAKHGEEKFEELADKLSEGDASPGGWAGDATYHVPFISGDKRLGRLILHGKEPAPKEEQVDIDRALRSVARLVSTALESGNLVRG